MEATKEIVVDTATVAEGGMAVKGMVKAAEQKAAQQALKAMAPAAVKAGEKEAAAEAGAAATKAADSDVALYHGSRDGIAGGRFDLSQVKPARRPGHLTSEDPAVFLTDDPARAATQYATPRGEVARAVVSQDTANSMKQLDQYGRPEFKATTQEQIEELNAHLEIKSTREAILEWVFGKPN